MSVKRKRSFADALKQKANRFKKKVTGGRQTTRGRDYSEADGIALRISCAVVEERFAEFAVGDEWLTLQQISDRIREGSLTDISSTFSVSRVSSQKVLKFTMKGRWISLNYIMSKVHWSIDTGIVDIVKRKVRDAIKNLDIWFDAYRIELRYNSRLDDHNCVMMPKYYTDVIKRSYLKDSRGKYIASAEGAKTLDFAGFIADDDKRYSRGTNFIPDERLPHDTYVLTYIPVPFEDFKKAAVSPKTAAPRAKRVVKSRVRVQLPENNDHNVLS